MEEEENPPRRRTAESIIAPHIHFSHRHASRFSAALSHQAHFCLFSIPHSTAISHATHHHQNPPAHPTNAPYNSTAREDVIVRQTRMNEPSNATTKTSEQKCGKSKGRNTSKLETLLKNYFQKLKFYQKFKFYNLTNFCVSLIKQNLNLTFFEWIAPSQTKANKEEEEYFSLDVGSSYCCCCLFSLASHSTCHRM